MIILAFVDIHNDLKAIKTIVKRAEKVDLLICAGDISVFEQNLGNTLSQLDKIGKPVFIIHGNHETPKILRHYCTMFKNLHYIHNELKEHGGIVFFGWGGGGFSSHDEEFVTASKAFSNKLKKADKAVLITHAPPYNTKVDMVNGKSRGNKSIRDFINDNKLDLAICGHLHENAGKYEVVSETLVINPGPLGKKLKL